MIGADKHRKIKFCCLQSKAAEPYMKVCGLDREDVSHRFLFIEGPGLCYQGSTGENTSLSLSMYITKRASLLPFFTLVCFFCVPLLMLYVHMSVQLH